MSLNIQLAYENIEEIKTLFQEYTQILGIDLDFQNYDNELQNLPGDYAPPNGRLYIAKYDNKAAGCIAVRPFNDTSCEMKRFFVRPEFRKQGIGIALANKIIIDAKNMHYQTMYLDTLATLTDSLSIYKKLGFKKTNPYCYNPSPNALYFKLKL